MRKYKDTYKLQLVAETKKIYERQPNQDQHERLINEILECVLKVFFRISQLQESEEDLSFQLDYYKDLIHNNWLIDVAKLYDLAAVYGQSNPEVVKAIINNVFENDKRFI